MINIAGHTGCSSTSLIVTDVSTIARQLYRRPACVEFKVVLANQVEVNIV